MCSSVTPSRWIASAAIALLIGLCGPAQAQTTLKVLNWSEYIGPDTVAKFEKATGIKVAYSILDSDDTLQAKLLSGNSGFDVVYPSSNYMSKQIKAGLFEPVDWTKIPNKKHLDAAVMAQTAKNDPDNKFGVPYVWGTEGLIINMTKARQVWGGDLPPLSFDLLFKPENAKKLQKCGIALIDQPSEASTMLAYMGRDPNSPKLSDTEDAFKELAKIRPYIKLFSNNVLQDVSSGNICITTGWSGDYNVMKRRAKAAGKDFDIRYATPKGATGLWFTMMGIPKDSKNKDAAHKWINFLLSPEIAAENSNEITYTSAVGAARALVKPELANDPFLYPSEAEMAEYFAFKPQDTALLRVTNKLWLRYKSGR